MSTKVTSIKHSFVVYDLQKSIKINVPSNWKQPHNNSEIEHCHNMYMVIGIIVQRSRRCIMGSGDLRPEDTYGMSACQMKFRKLCLQIGFMTFLIWGAFYSSVMMSSAMIMTCEAI